MSALAAVLIRTAALASAIALGGCCSKGGPEAAVPRRCAETKDPRDDESAHIGTFAALYGATYLAPVKRFWADSPTMAPYSALIESTKVLVGRETTAYPIAWARGQGSAPLIEIDAQFVSAHRAAVEIAVVEAGWFPEATGYLDLILQDYRDKLSADRLCERPPAWPPGRISRSWRPGLEGGADGGFAEVFEEAVTEVMRCYLAYIVAHEIAHHALGHTSQESTPDQERAADRWALSKYSAAGLPALALASVFAAEARLEALRADFDFRPETSHPTWAERLRMTGELTSARNQSDCVVLQGRMASPGERGVTRGPFVTLQIPEDLDETRSRTATLDIGQALPLEGTARRDGADSVLRFRAGADLYEMRATRLRTSGYVTWTKRPVGAADAAAKGVYRALVYRSKPVGAMTFERGSACSTRRGRMLGALEKIGVTGDLRAAAARAIEEAETAMDDLVARRTEGDLGEASLSEATRAAALRRNEALERLLGKEKLDALLSGYRGDFSFALPDSQ